MKLLFKILCVLLLISCSDNTAEVIAIEENEPTNALQINVDLGISFPPVADQTQRNFSLPLLSELNVKKIRIGENWSFREPTQGNFNWSSLDERIQWATANNIEILLTIQSNGPSWACSQLQNQNSCVYNDLDAFKNYIELLLQRYPNQIAKIQYGNEWMSNFWYVGNAQQFTEATNIVYNAIQTYAPNTKFVLGGFTTISLRFLAGCDGLLNTFFDDEGNVYDQDFLNNNCNNAEVQEVVQKIEYVLTNAQYDEVDIHLYDDVDNWKIYYNYMNSRTTKPIIITEFGGPNVNIEPTDETYQSEQLIRYVQSIDSMNVEEAYFFKLVEGTNNPAHTESGLINNTDLSKKESFFTFKTLNQ